MSDTGIANIPLPSLPQMPPNQRIFDVENQFTPDARFRLSSLKHKVSEMSLSSPPKTGAAYIKWRIHVVRKELEVMKCMRASLKEAFENGNLSRELYEAHRAKTFDTQDNLEDEELNLCEQGKFFEEFLSDSLEAAESVYIHELYGSWRQASKEGQKSLLKKEKNLDQYKFNNQVANYFSTERDIDGVEQFCSILGCWIGKNFTKCAHIVPKSFDTKNLAYIFGVNDTALCNVRNGLIMNRVVEEGFDNGWITIVPYGSVESTPTEWKSVFLKDEIKNNMILKYDRRIWCWKDLHERKLVFQNDNRPARRYLYFHHVMALLHAEYQGWEGYREKVPPGRIWVSPNEPEGYLRKSVLRCLA